MKSIVCASALAALGAAGAANAATLHYDILFSDASGAPIGSGAMTYDDQLMLDVYINADSVGADAIMSLPAGAPVPAEPGYVYQDSWTPLLALDILFDGQTLASFNAPATAPQDRVFTEGLAWIYPDGGAALLDYWFFGDQNDTAVGLFDLPVFGGAQHLASYTYVTPEEPYLEGTVIFTMASAIAPVPVPPNAMLLIGGLGGFGAVASRRRRRCA